MTSCLNTCLFCSLYFCRLFYPHAFFHFHWSLTLFLPCTISTFTVKAFGIHSLMTGILLVLTSLFTHLRSSTGRLDDWLRSFLSNSRIGDLFCLPVTSLGENSSFNPGTDSSHQDSSYQDSSSKGENPETRNGSESLTLVILDRILLVIYVIVSFQLWFFIPLHASLLTKSGYIYSYIYEWMNEYVCTLLGTEMKWS